MQPRQRHDLCAHPSHRAGKCTDHQCDSRLRAACRASSRSSLAWRQRPPPACAFWKLQTHSGAVGEWHSKKPDTPGKTWQPSASSQCRNHNPHPPGRLHPSQEGWAVLPLTFCQPDEPALCSCSAQVCGWKGVYTGDMCKHHRDSPGPSSHLHSPYSSCDHSEESQGSSVNPSIWSRIKDLDPYSSLPSWPQHSNFHFLWNQNWLLDGRDFISYSAASSSNSKLMLLHK